ncbi:MAG: Multidrug resistance protein MdtA [Candidatus Ordinivivax streblomastigis]|uniref:Multidrug resistance protein MdtA n=1 Tax=Candidatus Ordinivivax streblomastigis TaxID=2540710 RepID=A0A5M8NVI4_9BACT|nr:MAG: Multidrug resistance protein MdtA [Candidatus Ordinivivax streblomastigis]
MKKHIYAFVMVAMCLSGCNGHEHNHDDDEQEHAHKYNHTHEGEEHDEHPDEIEFTKAQAEAAGLQIQTIAPGTFKQVIRTSGQILAAQGDETMVVATSNGVISFAGAAVADGAAVRLGESIATISAKNLLEGDPTEKVRIEYETALKEYRRAEGLIKDNIISAKDFEQIRQRYETAGTAYKAHADNAIPNGVKITAPLTGYIKNKWVNQGEYVSVGQPIAVISQNKLLQLRAEVPEKYYSYLKGIHDANFKPAYDSHTVYKLSELNGRLLSFGKASNVASFYIPITFEFNNTGEIIPGSFVEIYLLSTVQNNVISVPISALTEEQGLYFVYLQLEDEVYKKQEVAPGEDDGERVRILSGLKSGDRIVAKGVYQVKLAAISSIVPEAHTHSH